MGTLTVVQAAERMNTCTRTVLRYIDQCKLPAAKIGKGYVLLEEDVMNFITAEVVAQTEDRQAQPFTIKKRRVRKRAGSSSA